MRGKTCLVTGGNSGIGKVIVLKLAEAGARVVIACRNKEKGQIAKKEIIEKTGNKNIDLLFGDFSSFKSVRELAKNINSKCKKLDVLVNNAGAFFTELKYSEDKIEMQFQVNYLSHFLLTNLILKTLKKSSCARIINVASGRYKKIKGINYKDINFEKGYDGLKAYAQSKLAVILFTYELSQRLKSSGITVNCLNPGRIRTNIGTKNASGFYAFGWRLIKTFMSSPEKGAKTSVYLACSDEVKNITGKYFEKSKIKKHLEKEYKREETKKLWNLSVKLTGLKKVL